MIFLAGLPRTGSTVLSSILAQNPNIYTGTNSPVCQLMINAEESCMLNSTNGVADQLRSANRTEFKQEYVSAIPDLYYKNVTQPFVVDKCRSWIWPENIKLIKEYLTPNPKIIVLTRNKKEIVESFKQLMMRNKVNPIQEDLEKWVEGFFRPEGTGAVQWAKENNNGEFSFYTYDEFMTDPKNVLLDIYKFCEWDFFEHDFKNIKCKYPEDDSVHGSLFTGMHEVRPVLGYRQIAA